ncbi:MBL fold metallo-hydrolase [Aspergillus puulaauensis]|uniref:Metallo-beta-lactamase domain-containing protein n=1 Tax=Aspergillus puulaauensis TaxID=1220207 RepID=A0A7R7XY00_9EURO|nr:uncharacterized protein APUU_80039S [Aspergillus puulaauensis]BCS29736.1 hypothetical protein APUU_80039S [Aspergillus puulaauensis]
MYISTTSINHHTTEMTQIPSLNIPRSSQSVNVHVIDTTVKIDGPADFFLKPRVGNLDRLVANAFTFLIEHPVTKQKVAFDLGVRKDANELSSPFWKGFRENFVIDVEKDVADILQDNNVDLTSIDAIIWSHCHADHTGDPSTFPPCVDLVFGPGAPAARLPGYPTNQKSSLFETDYHGRKLVEITQDRFNLQLGEFRAFDYFGDGSFYLLDVPGHDIGHVCGLARTTANGTQTSDDDSFVLMGADTCHHTGQLRPSEFLTLPSEIKPHPNDSDVIPAPFASTRLEEIHPKGRMYHCCPFYEVGVLDNGFSMSESPEETGQSITKMMPFDAAPNVLLVLAHDVTLQDTVSLFPAKVNGWEDTSLKDETRWRFLRDWATALE